MKAKQLLSEAFTFRKGKAYLPIVQNVISGEINPNKTYIQVFDRYTFNSNADVEFVTLHGEVSLLYQVD